MRIRADNCETNRLSVHNFLTPCVHWHPPAIWKHWNLLNMMNRRSGLNFIRHTWHCKWDHLYETMPDSKVSGTKTFYTCVKPRFRLWPRTSRDYCAQVWQLVIWCSWTLKHAQWHNDLIPIFISEYNCHEIHFVGWVEVGGTIFHSEGRSIVYVVRDQTNVRKHFTPVLLFVE